VTARPSPAHATANALAFTGIGLLVASAIAELSDLHPRAELTMGAAAGVAFLLAMALSRGGDPQVLDRRGRLLIGTALSALLAVAALWQITEYAAPRVLLLLIPVALLFSTAGLAVREAAVQRRRAQVRELRARLQGEEAERRRWVRELHDDTLQELAAVMVVLGAAETQGPAITEARELVGRQIQTLRRLIAQMRPLALDSLGLNAALEDLGQHAHDATGVDIEVVAEPLPPLPSDTETSLYRVVQEALTNAVRHSGAGHITIRTAVNDGAVVVSVADNGGGRPGFAAGHGITGMRERADALGARLEILGRPGGGTEVRLTMPPDAATSGK
jgi:signal transduction histidine kinase